MIINGMLPEFIDNMIEQINEDKLWQLYLATALLEEKSFGDWKAAVMSETRSQNNPTGHLIDEPTPEEAVAHAESILAGFKLY